MTELLLENPGPFVSKIKLVHLREILEEEWGIKEKAKSWDSFDWHTHHHTWLLIHRVLLRYFEWQQQNADFIDHYYMFVKESKIPTDIYMFELDDYGVKNIRPMSFHSIWNRP